MNLRLRRRLLLSCLAAPTFIPGLARGQRSWPDGPIRLVVPSGAGGNPDIMARLVADPLSAALRVPVVVENRPGVAGNLGTEFVVRSRPDGQTLLLGSVSNAINQSFFRNMTFDWLRDLQPVAPMYLIPNILLASKDLPVTTVAELVEMARAEPGKLTYASPGIGTSLHLAGELLKLSAGIDMLHVPYRSTTAAGQDLEGGRVHIMFENLPPALPRIDGGRVRALAVTAPSRSQRLPEVPTVGEAGFPDLQMLIWGGLFAPSGTPAPVVERLHAETLRITDTPAFRERLAQLGSTEIGRDLGAFRQFTIDETRRWARAVDASGARSE